MRYIDICSGISAPTMAWHPLGWRPLCFAEIEAAPRAVLAHHYPEVPLRGDFTQIRGDEYGPVDLLVGGTPCQDFSVAGLRAGLDGERGNLSLEYLRLADRSRPRWLVWENVPGVLSIDGGRAFGAILGGLAELGYGFAYRILDAQHFGVPQRRRRVFVVGHLGDWRRAAAVLFERHGLSGHPAPRREKGPGVAALTANGVGTCGADDNQGQAGHLIPQGCGGETAPTLNSAFGSKLGLDNQHIDSGAGLFVAHSLRAEGFDASEDGTGRGTPLVPVAIQERAVCENPDAGPDGAGFRTDGMAYTLEARTVPQAVAFAQNQRDELRTMDVAGALAAEPGMKQQTYIAFSAKDHGADALENCSPTLRADGHSGSHANAGVMPAVAFAADVCPTLGRESYSPMKSSSGGALDFSIATASAVRRLTPRECERLQGFPDDFTLVPYRKGMMADGPRYKMLGNSMAVPVVRWIGERIEAVEALALAQQEAA